MPDLTSGGLRIHYAAAPAAPRSPAVVFLHGAGANHTIWLAQMKALRERAWVAIPDLPAHGRSAEIPGLTIEEYAEALVPFLRQMWAAMSGGSREPAGLTDARRRSQSEGGPDELGRAEGSRGEEVPDERGRAEGSRGEEVPDEGGRAEGSHGEGSLDDPAALEQAVPGDGGRAAWIRHHSPGAGRLVLAGHSMGGAIALTIALNHPELVSALVLVGTGAKLGVSPEILDGLRTAPMETQAMIARWSFTPRADPALIIKTMKNLVGTAPGRTLTDFRACSTFDVRARITQLSIPVLLVCGDEDHMTPPKFSAWIAERLPRATLRIVEGAGHAVMIEASETVSEAIAEFLLTLDY